MKAAKVPGILDSRAAAVVSCWLAIAIISAVYIWVFADKVADILFGIFLPIGLLVLVAVVVTFSLMSRPEPEKKPTT